jgi:hypothetical protein
MRYDPQLPVAVFLGPSLDRHTAEKLLPANYYPPARMGDVYRLLATGVELILIVDGVFHETTPVWQREIVAALRSGITVVGASSMGALRAAELAPFGMIGRGRIFELFRSGELDGDDEVALLHGDESLGHRPLSLPLVNLRHDLARAADAGLIPEAVARDLVAEVKQRHFRERQLPLLHGSPALAALDEAAVERLLDFLRNQAEDLKRSDALDALHYCAALVAGSETAPASPPPPVDAPPSTFPAIEALHRGLLRSDGSLVVAEQALERLPGEELGRRRPALHLRFFLGRYLEEAGVGPPDAEVDAFRERWLGDHAPADSKGWLRSIGLTVRELDQALAESAAIRWLLGTEPESLGIDFATQRRCVAALVGWLSRRDGAGAPGVPELLEEAAQSAYLAFWACSRGIAPPAPDAVEAFVAAWERHQQVGSRQALLEELQLEEAEYRRVFAERAFFHELLARGPIHYGYATWSLPLALLRDLQLDGGLERLLESEPLAQP